MFAVCWVAAVAHTPTFASGSAFDVSPEPSQAFYCLESATFTISYKKNDPMLIQILLPDRHGFWEPTETVKNVSVAYDEACIIGTAVAPTSHNKYKAPNTVFDEPWATGTYRTALTVVSERVADNDKTCVVRVNGSKYVFVVGTKEDLLEPVLVGLPYYVTMVSAWNDNYVYGTVLLILVVVWLVLHYIEDEPANSESDASFVVVVLVATVVNRAAQYRPLGWAKLGPGLAWIVMPIAAMAFVWWYAFVDATKIKRRLIAVLVLAVLPTKSWLDVAAALTVTWLGYRRTHKRMTA